ncbi:MAG: DUF1802 family protein [Calothrix sp. MO_192.B10]|nr:DUF1802 family protein [Calothrix sp. MO_192.B10]
MKEPTKTFHALKEWAVAIHALEAGKTIMLLRKGGIRERGGKFQVAHNQIVLYPTYEHQQPFLLKPDYANLAIPVTSGWYPDMVKITSWAEITHILPVTDESIIRELLPFHIWNENFIHQRLQWKPTQPLFILTLRTYKLPQVQEIPHSDKYGGCKSWIDLAQSINLTIAKPVLSDSEYNQLIAEIRKIIGNRLYTPSDL